MRKIIVLLSVVLFMSSCAEETNPNAITAKSVKDDISTSLNTTEWEPTSNAYYSKIVFIDGIIEVTRNGVKTRVGYAVTNIFGTMTEAPDVIQLRLKSGLLLDEIYLDKDYSKFKNVIRSDVNSTFTSDSDYRRIK